MTPLRKSNRHDVPFLFATLTFAFGCGVPFGAELDTSRELGLTEGVTCTGPTFLAGTTATQEEVIAVAIGNGLVAVGLHSLQGTSRVHLYHLGANQRFEPNGGDDLGFLPPLSYPNQRLLDVAVSYPWVLVLLDEGARTHIELVHLQGGSDDDSTSCVRRLDSAGGQQVDGLTRPRMTRDGIASWLYQRENSITGNLDAEVRWRELMEADCTRPLPTHTEVFPANWSVDFASMGAGGPVWAERFYPTSWTGRREVWLRSNQQWQLQRSSESLVQTAYHDNLAVTVSSANLAPPYIVPIGGSGVAIDGCADCLVSSAVAVSPNTTSLGHLLIAFLDFRDARVEINVIGPYGLMLPSDYALPGMATSHINGLAVALQTVVLRSRGGVWVSQCDGL